MKEVTMTYYFEKGLHWGKYGDGENVWKFGWLVIEKEVTYGS